MLFNMRTLFALLLALCVYSPAYAVGLDDNTKLLLHFDGTSLADSSTSNNKGTATAAGDANANDDEGKFTGSLDLDGTGDYITFPANSDFDVFGDADADWTIDWWQWLDAAPTTNVHSYSQRAVGGDKQLFAEYDSGAVDRDWET